MLKSMSMTSVQYGDLGVALGGALKSMCSSGLKRTTMWHTQEIMELLEELMESICPPLS